MKKSVRFALLSIFGTVLVAAGWGQTKYVIVDQDASGPGGSDQQAIMVFLQAPQVHVLGITVVTGDAWRDEEVAHTLRTLELLGRRDIPVVPGAVFPMVRTQQWTQVWQQTYGKIVWLGAWGRPGIQTHGPYEIPPMKEGKPSIKPLNEDAAHFMVRMVHKYPHQVTIYAAGPMTNVAKAVGLDPSFAGLTKGLVFMGGSLNPVTQEPEFANDPRHEFNLWFDPEAAHIVLHAHWPSITCTTTDVSLKTNFSQQIMDDIAKSKNPAAQYITRYSKRGFYLWDELAAAAWLDPSLITRTKTVYMDVDLDRGYGYGDTVVWTENVKPLIEEQKVQAQMDVDMPKFAKMFVRMMTAETPGSKDPVL
jgi:purine nucleosidase